MEGREINSLMGMAQSENRLESFTQCGGLAAMLHSSFGEARESKSERTACP
jgi:hypothetical protein